MRRFALDYKPLAMEVLGGTPPSLFDLLSADDLALLERRSVRVRFEDGQRIHDRGDPIDRFTAVVQGAVRFLRTGRNGQQITSATLGAGQFFGVFPFHTRNGRPHDSIAVGPTVVDQMSAPDFIRLIDERPPILRAMFEITAYRLRRLTELYNDARISTPDVRIAKLLLMSIGAGKPADRIECLNEDICQALGLSSGTVAQSLRRLADGGIIAKRYGAIEVLDRNKLERFIIAEE